MISSPDECRHDFETLACITRGAVRLIVLGVTEPNAVILACQEGYYQEPLFRRRCRRCGVLVDEVQTAYEAEKEGYERGLWGIPLFALEAHYLGMTKNGVYMGWVR